MKQNFAKMALLFVLILSLAGSAQAVPSITSISSAVVTQDETLVITGENFGTKATAAPDKWDYISNNSSYDDDNLVAGDPIPVGASEVWNSYYKPQYVAYYGDTNPRVAGRPYMTATGTGAVASTDPGDATVAQQMIVNWWIRSDNARWGINKFIRMYGDTDAAYPDRHAWCNKEIVYKLAGPDCPDSYVADSDWIQGLDGTPAGTWVNLEIRYDSRNSESCDNEGRIYVTISVEGQPIQTHTSPFYAPRRLHFIRSLGQNVNQAIGPTDAKWDWTEIYVDYSWSRVVIGNAATYAECDHKEMQIPSAWADDEVSVTLNQGTFEDGENLWLYVFDSENLVNATGTPIQFGTATEPDPEINGVPSTIRDGESFKIQGLGFGTKPVLAPVIWDYIANNSEYDDDALTEGDAIPVGAGEIWSGYYNVPCYYGDTNPRVTGRPYFTATGTGALKLDDLGDDTVAKKLYVNWWLRTDTVQASSLNKFLRVWGQSDGTTPDRFTWNWKQISTFQNNADCVDFETVYAAKSGWVTTKLQDNVDTWVNMETFLDSEYSHLCNGGVASMYEDGALRISQTYYAPERLHHIKALGQDINVASGPADAKWDWTEVYVDTTFARVMLGNASTWAASTHREIQIITAWNKNEVTITPNFGTFSTGDEVYAYVSNRDGTVSNASDAITIVADKPAITSDVILVPNGTFKKITGTNFGEKYPAVPFSYMNFEEGTQSTDVGSGPNGKFDNSTNFIYTKLDKYAGLLSGQSTVTSVSTAPFFNSSRFIYNQKDLYVSFNWKATSYAGSLSPHEINLVSFNTATPDVYSGTPNLNVTMDAGSTTFNAILNEGLGGENSLGTITSSDYNYAGWNSFSAWVHLGDVGVANGYAGYQNNGTIVEETDIVTLYSGTFTGFENISILNKFTHAGSDATVRIDNLYMDISMAKVVIGNNVVFGDCTLYEIQTPLTWSDTEIIFLSNFGVFTHVSTVWLFVIDSNNRVSDGYSIDLTDDTPMVPHGKVFPTVE